MENIIPIVTKTQDEIESDAQTSIQNSTKVTLRTQTSTSNAIVEMVAEQLAPVYSNLGDAMRSAYLSTATGIGLDRIGDFFQLTRNDSKVAEALGKDTFQFYLDLVSNESISSIINLISADTITANPTTFPTPGSLVIKAKTFISTVDGKMYMTLDDVTLDDTHRAGFTGVMATGSGDGYNVGVGDLTTHSIETSQPELTQIRDYIKCTNVQAINSGSPVEGDDDFRWRISTALVANANANMTAIRHAILSVPGVSDYMIRPRIYGNGTTGVIIQTVSPVTDDGTLNAVSAAIDIAKVQSEQFYIVPPEYLGVMLSIGLFYKPNADVLNIQTQALSAIVTYINGLPLGGTIVMNEIVDLVMNISQDITDVSFVSFGMGTYDRTTGDIGDDYQPLKISNQQCDWNQKFFAKGSWISVCQLTTR